MLRYECVWALPSDQFLLVKIDTMGQPIETILSSINDPAIDFTPSKNLRSKRLQGYAFSKSRVQKVMKLENDLYLVKVPTAIEADTEQLVAQLREKVYVKYIEPDLPLHAFDAPNDPLFPEEWTCNVIHCERAWDIVSGGNKAIAVIVDSGVDLQHEDLKKNLWKNMGEDWLDDDTPGVNGVDDDQNGFVDDYYGFNFLNGYGDVTDGYGHGTFINGIIAAEGDNAIGIAGLNWHLQVVNLKILDDDGGGFISDAINAINYAIWLKKHEHKPVIVNISWGVGQFSQALEDAMKKAYEEADILFVVAAGNNSSNIDDVLLYPASYDLPNILSVAAIDEDNRLAGYSNYGKNTVDIAAPGSSIISTYLENQYLYKSGTSFATAFVSGTCLLILNAEPTISAMALKDIIISNATPLPDLDFLVSSGGVLNTWKSVMAAEGIEFGDVNSDGHIDIVDVIILARYIAGLKLTSNINFYAADLNWDQNVDVTDLILLTKYATGINEEH